MSAVVGLDMSVGMDWMCQYGWSGCGCVSKMECMRQCGCGCVMYRVDVGTSVWPEWMCQYGWSGCGCQYGWSGYFNMDGFSVVDVCKVGVDLSVGMEWMPVRIDCVVSRAGV